jgi:hypothetical protein
MIAHISLFEIMKILPLGTPKKGFAVIRQKNNFLETFILKVKFFFQFKSAMNMDLAYEKSVTNRVTGLIKMGWT